MKAPFAIGLPSFQIGVIFLFSKAILNTEYQLTSWGGNNSTILAVSCRGNYIRVDLDGTTL